jgi:hypothetical protein
VPTLDPLVEQVETLQHVLISRAIGQAAEGEDYHNLRGTLVTNPTTKGVLPRFVRPCRDLSQFWQFIKPKFDAYEARR